MQTPSRSADLMIQLIDEVLRGRARFLRAESFYDLPELHGLSGTVLTAIVLAAHPPTVPQIGRSLSYPRQTIQRQADQLVQLGFARFVENPDHKRAHRLAATPLGRELHRKADEKSHRWAAEFTAGIAPDKLAVTVETLRLIRHRLETEARGEAPPRPSAVNA